MGGKAGLFMHISAGEGHVTSITYMVEEGLQADVICGQSGIVRLRHKERRTISCDAMKITGMEGPVS